MTIALCEKEYTVECNGDAVLFLDAGMYCGIGIGLFDALNAIAAHIGYGSSFYAITALLLLTFLYGALGSLIIFLMFRFFRISSVASAERNGIAKILPVKFLQLCLIVMGVSMVGLGVGRAVEKLFPLSSHYLIVAVAGFLATVLASAFGSRIINTAIKRPSARALLVTGIVCLVLVGVVLFGAHGLTDEIDSGQKADSLFEAVSNTESPNVVLVVMDAVRADHLSVYGYDRKTTPFLSKLAEESTVYKRAISAAPWTLPSHASMFIGQYPSEHKATFEHRYLSDQLVTIADILRKKGFATAAFTGGKNTFEQSVLSGSVATYCDQGIDDEE